MHVNNIQFFCILLVLVTLASCATNDSSFYSDGDYDSLDTDHIDHELVYADEHINDDKDEPIGKIEIVHPAPKSLGCERVDAADGRSPNVFYINQRWYVTYSEWSEEFPWLYVRSRGVNDDSWSEPETVAYGVSEATMSADGDTLLLMAVRQFYKVEFSKTPGDDNWIEGSKIPNEKTYICDGYEPAHYLTGKDGHNWVVTSFDYNTGIFGCTTNVWLAHRNESGFDEPKQIGNGEAVGGVLNGSNMLLAGVHMYLSENGGETFSKLKGGDKTNDQIRGEGLAQSESKILAIQTYNYANKQNLVILESEDFGKSWPVKLIVKQDTLHTYKPKLSADGKDVVAAWFEQNSPTVQLITSPDGGEKWSATLELAPDPNVSVAQDHLSLAMNGKRIAVGVNLLNQETGEREAWVCFVE